MKHKIPYPVKPMGFLPSHFRKTTGEIAWDILTKARAIENQVYFCACNQTGEGNCRNTRIISYNGEVIGILPKEEGMLIFMVNTHKSNDISSICYATLEEPSKTDNYLIKNIITMECILYEFKTR